MSYALAITPEAEDDLEKLVANPQLAARGILGRPTYRFGFKAQGVGYHWAAIFKYSQDERFLVVTQLYKVAL